MCGYVETLLTLVYPDEVVDAIADFIISHVSGYALTSAE